MKYLLRKNMIRKFKLETPKNIWVDEFVCQMKMYSFKCGVESKNKSKGISKSQSKHIKMENYKKF